MTSILATNGRMDRARSMSLVPLIDLAMKTLTPDRRCNQPQLGANHQNDAEVIRVDAQLDEHRQQQRRVDQDLCRRIHEHAGNSDHDHEEQEDDGAVVQ